MFGLIGRIALILTIAALFAVAVLGALVAELLHDVTTRRRNATLTPRNRLTAAKSYSMVLGRTS